MFAFFLDIAGLKCSLTHYVLLFPVSLSELLVYFGVVFLAGLGSETAAGKKIFFISAFRLSPPTE
jgi:hypothetical protein